MSLDMAKRAANVSARGCMASGTAAAFVTFGCAVWAAAAQADVLADRGGTWSFDSATNTVTATAQAGTTLPVGLLTGSATSIVATVGGTLSFGGLPFGPEPQLDGVINYPTTGECALDIPCNDLLEAGVDAGDITVTIGSAGGAAGADTITADDVLAGTSGPGGLILRSRGGPGLGGAGAETLVSSPDAYSVLNARGTASGLVTVEFMGSAAVAVSGAGTGGSTDSLAPTLVGVSAHSIGGGGSAIYWDSGGDEIDAYIGYGGTSAGASVTTAAGSTISVIQSGDGANAVGIDARSIGGKPGAILNAGQEIYSVADGGAAGPVEVAHGGRITVDANQGFGISAVAIGGNGNDSDCQVAEPLGLPGNGGAVTVTMDGSGAIDMREGGGGVFASSQAGAWTPNGRTELPNGGNVTVTIAQGASVTTGSAAPAASPLAFGVMGLSSGTRLVSDLQNAPDLQGTGVAGSDTIVNGGTIATNGPSAVGVAALGIGGKPTTARFDVGNNTVGNTTDISVVGGCSTLPEGCASVSLTNTGSATTLGVGAAGLVAISSGGGGIVQNDAAAAIDSDSN